MTKFACICEGAFEQAVIDILLEHRCLIFSNEELLEEETLRTRSAKNFQRRHLNKLMKEKIIIYRIIDSQNEKFNMTGPYIEKVKEVVNIITAPEIEILVIHAEDCYDHYSRSHMKPSEYVKQHLNFSNVKSYAFAKGYFKNVTDLKNAIRTYHSKTKDKENTLLGLIKE